MNRKKFTVQQLCICAAMIALHIVLEFVSIRIGNDYKITFSGLPILIIAVLYGPFYGFFVGLIAAVLSQLLTFGITPTTIFWIWPPAIHGLAMGLFYRAFGSRMRFVPKENSSQDVFEAGSGGSKAWKTIVNGVLNPLTICIFAAGLINTACNLAATYFDSKFWNYYYEGYILVLIPIRLVNWALTAVVCSIIAGIVIAVLQKRFPGLFRRPVKQRS